jgi:tRNA1(Val) A37 N6-methylase TrmN6
MALNIFVPGTTFSASTNIKRGMEDILQAQNHFPRGLYQPPGSFRFSADALLLASFAEKAFLPGNKRIPLNLMDLGCGCGVVAFALMLRNPDFDGLGLELQETLVRAAGFNARKLGFSHRYKALAVNLELLRSREDYARLCADAEQDLITANPPYRLTGSGRLPKSASRSKALFGDENTLAAFVRVAGLALSDSGFFCLILPFSRREELFSRLVKNGLAPVRELRVYNKDGADRSGTPDFVLIASRRRSVSPPESEFLVLYRGSGAKTVLTAEARSFCPFLVCGGLHTQR